MSKQPLTEGDLELVKPFLPEDVTSPIAYIQLIRSQIMGGKGSIADLVYFLEVSKRAGLNPTIKQTRSKNSPCVYQCFVYPFY